MHYVLKHYKFLSKLLIVTLPILVLIFAKLKGYIILDEFIYFHPYFRLKLWFMNLLYFLVCFTLFFRSATNLQFIISLLITMFISIYLTNNSWSTMTWRGQNIYYVNKISNDDEGLFVYKISMRQFSKPEMIVQLPKGDSPILFLKNGDILINYIEAEGGISNKHVIIKGRENPK